MKEILLILTSFSEFQLFVCLFCFGFYPFMSHVLGATAWFDSSEENKKQKQKATGAEERTEAASTGRK